MDGVELVENICAELRRLNADYEVTPPGKRAAIESHLRLFLMANRHYIADALGAIVAENRHRMKL